MTENNIPLFDELRPLVSNISREVLDQVAPDESAMIDLFMGSYYKPLTTPANLDAKAGRLHLNTSG